MRAVEFQVTDTVWCTPPSGLPPISPTGGEIDDRRRRTRRSPPWWGRCPAGQRGASPANRLQRYRVRSTVKHTAPIGAPR